MRWLDALLAALFAWAASLQLNDPDPIQWFAVYALGALMAALAGLAPLVGLVGRHSMGRWALALSAGLLSLSCAAWAGAILFSMVELLETDPARVLGFSELSAPMTPDRPEVEWVRETLGLMMVGTWSAGISWRMRAAKGARRP